MGRTASVRQPLDATHGRCGHGARTQEVVGGDRARHAPLQPLHASCSKMPTSLRAMPLDAAAATASLHVPLLDAAATCAIAASATLLPAVAIWIWMRWGWGGGEGVTIFFLKLGEGVTGAGWPSWAERGQLGWVSWMLV